jgi:hypothetical protein
VKFYYAFIRLSNLFVIFHNTFVELGGPFTILLHLKEKIEREFDIAAAQFGKLAVEITQ